jgi:N-acetylmuramic acid 6-phosphate etherase
MSTIQFHSLTESISDRYNDLESQPLDIAISELWESQRDAVEAVRPALPAIGAAVQAAESRLRGGAGRLIYVGAGTSGRIGVQDGAELPPTFGWPQSRLALLMAGGPAAFTQAIENAEDDAAAAAREIAALAAGPGDVAIGIAASGGTPFTLAAIHAARAAGACTVAVANAGGGAILRAAEFPILAETGAEPISGSTRLKAGTAQKVVLNLFSTMLMIRLGHVYRGQMVDMQAKNQKLRLRARRMLAHLTGAADSEIEAALAATNFHIKPAVLMLLRGCDAAAARDSLARHEGHLRAALEESA